MSPDWFDPLGLRGSKLDPFRFFTDALRGEGIAGQSAELMATTMAQQLVGRRVVIEHDPPISATVERVDELRPASASSAVSLAAGEMPMWETVAGRLTDVLLGERRVRSIDIQARSLVLVGATAQRMRIGRVDAQATIAPEEIAEWAASVDGNYRVRVHEGRLEASDRRVEGWLWLEVDVAVRSGNLEVTPLALRAFGRQVPLLARFRQPVEREIDWLPAGTVITEVRADGGELLLEGYIENAVVSVDVTKALTDLGTVGAKSALRIALGDW